MRVVTLASGSRGVGKSVVAANLAWALAERGLDTCLVDLDLVEADLHLMTGVLSPRWTVTDLLRAEIPSLRAAMVDVPGTRRLSIVPGPLETRRTSALTETEIARLGQEILRLPADVVVVDLEAGVSHQILDLMLVGDVQWVVATAEQVSLEAAARLLRLARLRRTARGSVTRTSQRPRIYTSLDDLVRDMNALREESLPMADRICGPPGLIVTRCQDGQADIEERLSEENSPLQDATDEPSLAAEVPEDPAVQRSVDALRPLLSTRPESPAGQALLAIADMLAEDLESLTPAEETYVSSLDAEPAPL